MRIKETIGYEAPLVEVIEVEVEKGFAVSTNDPDAAGNDMSSGTGSF